MKANFKGELDMVIPCELLKVNMLSERQSSQKSPNRVEQFLAELLGLHTICLQSISLISAAIYGSCLFNLPNATLRERKRKGRTTETKMERQTDKHDRTSQTKLNLTIAFKDDHCPRVQHLH